MKRKELKQRNIFNLLIALIIIVLISYISSYVFVRFDLTSEKRYTLSKHSREMLKSLNDEVYIKVYLDGDDLPISFKRMQRSIKELLEEFKVYSSGNINYSFINPSESTDMKVRFGFSKQLYMKGLVPVLSEEQGTEGKTSQKMLFPGVVITFNGRELGVNLLKTDPQYKQDSEENINNSIQSLEYEFTNALQKLSRKKKPQIAFIEGHGELNEMQNVDITKTLSEYYDVKRGFISGKIGILDSFAAIIIAKPLKRFEEKDKYVIDQYIMKGGKILWLIDGTAINMDSLEKSPSTVAMMNELNIEDQLFKYGARVNPDLVLDMQCSPIGVAQTEGNGKTGIKLFSWLFFPLIFTHNNHTINKYMSLIKTEFISSVDTVSASEKIQKTILLTSSKFTKTEAVPVRISLDMISRKPQKQMFNDSYKPLAVLLEGTFESIYKNRLINQFTDDKQSFKAESRPTQMIVVGDGDIIKNEVSSKGDVYPLGFDKHSKKTFKGNTEFILNSLNYLCDDAGLMSIRTRELKLRLLDKDNALNNRTLLQTLNTLLPVLVVIIFGVALFFIRKRKYQ